MHCPLRHMKWLSHDMREQASVTHAPLMQVCPITHEAYAQGSMTQVPIWHIHPSGHLPLHAGTQVPGELPSVKQYCPGAQLIPSHGFDRQADCTQMSPTRGQELA